MADTMQSSPAGNCLERLKSYVRTQKGLILAGEILLSFIILICYASSLYGGYTAVAIGEMVVTIVFFVVFMMELDKQFKIIHWVWSDLIRAAIGSALYLITSLISVIQGGQDGARVAGGVFGLLAGLLFAYDAYITYLQLRNSSGHTAASTDDRV